MNKIIKLSCLVIVSLLTMTGCNETNVDKGIVNQPDNNVTKEKQENKYAKDNLINRFITLYNDSSSNLMDHIEHGNIRTKYYGYVMGRRIEMINASSSGYFSITINGLNDEKDVENIIAIYKDIIKIVDNDITDTMIEESSKMMKNSSTMIEDYKVTENTKITYVPAIQLSNRKTNCRIHIYAYDFK